VQFLLAFGGTTAVQKGPLWWASHHRAHHRYADTEQDVHSPLKGFWHSHVGWILADRHGATDLHAVRDLARFPELRFLDRHDWIGPWALGIGAYLLAGWSGLVVGFFLSTVLLWHATFLVNSLAHVMGRRRYATADTSRNSAVIAMLTFGEGWHNNHHHFPSAARQGFYWWELDVSWYVLRALAALRVVQGLRVPPAHVLERSRIAAGACDIGILRAHLMRALTAVARTSPPQDSLGRSPAVESTMPAGLLTKRQLVQDLVGGSVQAVEAYATAARRERAARRSEASA
jgi:stearoyl-CoA desaturase (delta-9 desaturase)